MRQTLQAISREIRTGAHSEVSLLLAGDQFIRQLNLEYRGKDSATDVLSFPQYDLAPPDSQELAAGGPGAGVDFTGILGDIVISIETAARQAEAASWPLESEMALLGSHGLLHLVGYDDESEDGAVEMERLSRFALMKASIALPSGDHPFFARFAP